MCNFLEYKGTSSFASLQLVSPCSTHALRVARADSKVVYRRYASLFFVSGIGQQDNELITLEVIHRCVAAAQG